MQASLRLAPLCALLAALSFSGASAGDPPKPDEAALRATITKSLGFLSTEGDRWIASKDCNGCHHMPGLLRSHREAQLRGFPIDQKKYEEWLAWTAERATDIKPGLEQVAFTMLALPERPAPELTKLIVAGQKADGSWAPAGQLADMQARGAADAQANAARIFLLALGTPASAHEELEAAQAKAAALLAKKDPPKTVDSLVYRALYARRFGPPEQVEATDAEILKHQRGDGGWSWNLGENQSDPLATGEALYVLQSATDPKAVAAIARAQTWLLATQRDDGSWPIDISHISKVDRSAPAKSKSLKDATGIYTYWGAAWATIGLLQAVPMESTAAK